MSVFLEKELISGRLEAVPGRLASGQRSLSRRIRVLFVNDHLGYDRGVTHGGTTYFFETLNSLDPDIVAPNLCILGSRHPAAVKFEDHGIVPIFLDRPKWDLMPLFDLVRVIRERQVDVLHLATMKSAVLGAIAGRLTGKRTILHLHDLAPLNPGLRFVQRFLSTGIDRAIAVSESVRQFGIREYGIPAERIEVIPNGIALGCAVDQPEAARHSIRRDLGIADKTPVFGITSRLFPDKGHTSLIRALPAILERCADPVLLIAGDGPTRAECEALVRQLGLQAAVKFLGHRNDIPDILAAVDVLVMPSTFEEGFGYSALEAIAAGRPVVAFASEAISHIVLHGRTGMLVDNGDIGGLAAAVSELLEKPDMARRLGEAGLRHARNFGIDRHARRLEALYLSLAAGADRAA